MTYKKRVILAALLSLSWLITPAAAHGAPSQGTVVTAENGRVEISSSGVRDFGYHSFLARYRYWLTVHNRYPTKPCYFRIEFSNGKNFDIYVDPDSSRRTPNFASSVNIRRLGHVCDEDVDWVASLANRTNMPFQLWPLPD